MDEVGLPYAILRTEKLTNWGSVSATLQHNCRTRPTENADPNGYIQILVGADKSAEIMDNMRIALQNIMVRKNAVLAIEVLLAASPEYFRPENPSAAGVYDKQRTQKFVGSAMQWAANFFGKDNIASAALHVDESTPHLQLVILPIDPKGKLNASHWLDGSKKLSEMQDAFADHIQPLGLRRGLRGSEAKHEPVKHFYAAASKPAAKELPLLRVPKKWERTPSIWSDLWTYPEMKAKYDAAQEAHEKGKLKLENARKHNQQLKDTNKLKANALDLAQRKQKEAVKTAEKLSQENEQLKIASNRMRAIPLADVLLKIYQAKISKHNQVRNTSKEFMLPDGRAVSILKDHKGESFTSADGKRYRGAIDLVMHLDSLNYESSLRLLSEHFDQNEVVADYVNRNTPLILTKVQENKKTQPVPAPTNEPKLWPKLVEWLADTQKLPKKLIDWLHQLGLLYSDAAGNAVFKRKNGGAFIQGVKPFFQRDMGGASCGPLIIPGKALDCYVTKTPLSACVIKAIHPESAVLAFGNDLIDLSNVMDLTLNTSNIILAGENEGRVNNLDYLKSNGSDIFLPPDGKSWANSILQDQSLIASEWLEESSDEVAISSSLKLHNPQ